MTRVWLARCKVEFPKQRPKIIRPWIQRWIARNNGAAIGPDTGFLYQSSSNWIRKNIGTDRRKCLSFSFFFAQHVVMRLMLKLMRFEPGSQILAEKFHPV